MQRALLSSSLPPCRPMMGENIVTLDTKYLTLDMKYLTKKMTYLTLDMTYLTLNMIYLTLDAYIGSIIFEIFDPEHDLKY